MKKQILIPILIMTHLLCLALGYGIGANQTTAIEESVEATVPSDVTTEAVTEPTKASETTEPSVLPAEDTTLPTEETEVATEETVAQDIPVNTPVATAPPATQPPTTEPSATNPPATEPPATQPPAVSGGNADGNVGGSGGLD